MEGLLSTGPTPSSLETGSLMLRHIIRINRVMYHYHILSLDREETVRKIYEKQKLQPLKGDWIQLLKSDFEFMGIPLDEQEIMITPKQVYRKKIKDLIRKAALNEITEEEKIHYQRSEI